MKKKTSNHSQFVTCRICHRQLRIIHAKHLVAHGITREEYMEKYDLDPDELICVDMRYLMSERPDYVPYTKRQLHKELRSIYRKHGKLGAKAIISNWPQLYEQAITMHGSWSEALREIGLESWIMEREREWTKKRVLAEMKALYRKNGHLKYVRNEYGSPLVWYAIKFFGSWREAIEAVGISERAAGMRRAWTKEKIAKIIQGGIKRSQLKESERNAFLSACRLHFGSVEKALAAQGRTWTEFHHGRTKWSKEEVLRQLREYRQKHGNDCGRIANTENRTLNDMARRLFGSWNEALRLAGIKPGRRLWSKEEILEEVREFLKDGNIPTSDAYVRRNNVRLVNRAAYHFGNWGAAVTAAGFTYVPAVQAESWSDEKVLSKIAELHARGEIKPRCGALRKYGKLYHAAKDRFGSWGNAVEIVVKKGYSPSTNALGNIENPSSALNSNASALR